jgi:2-phosphoglycerate kinase
LTNIEINKDEIDLLEDLLKKVIRNDIRHRRLMARQFITTNKPKSMLGGGLITHLESQIATELLKKLGIGSHD